MTYYLVKWRDSNYDMATWEPEDAPIPDFKKAVENYDNLRAVMFSEPGDVGRKKKGKKKKREDDSVDSPRPPNMPPPYPVSDVRHYLAT